MHNKDWSNFELVEQQISYRSKICFRQNSLSVVTYQSHRVVNIPRTQAGNAGLSSEGGVPHTADLLSIWLGIGCF